MKTRRWCPSPVLQWSGWLHGLALLLLLFWPGQWPWVLGLLLGNHALLTALGLWPRSRALGPNLRRLDSPDPVFYLTLDDGPDPEYTPRVLDILAAHGARASFFCPGIWVERHPELAREIVARGHRVENHSHRHALHFSLWGMAAMARDISQAQHAIERICGRKPRYFRAPAGLRSPLLDPVLHRLGLSLVSWTRRGLDTRDLDAARVLQRLTRDLRAGDILLLHDGHASRRALGPAVVLQVLPELLAQAARQGLAARPLPDEI